MQIIDTITLTRAEAEELYELIDALSGFNPENVFAWDGTDEENIHSKLYSFLGHKIPQSCTPFERVLDLEEE